MQKAAQANNYSGLMVYTRSGNQELEQPFEKPVIVPTVENQDPAAHAWADARFATDIMAEHGVFFALLMPPEIAGKEREEALRFSETFTTLHQQIANSAPPERNELKPFA